MNNSLNDLKNAWQKAKEASANSSEDIVQLIARAEKKRKSTIRFQINNIIILFVSVIGIWLFFEYVAILNFFISKIGIALMIGGLTLRIIIEIVSIVKSRKINLCKSALQTTNDTIKFYNFRKTIHGPITFSIVALYSIGFYMLTPEFSTYFSLPMLLFIDLSYVVGGCIMIWQVRKLIMKEMQDLRDIVRIRTELTSEV